MTNDKLRIIREMTRDAYYGLKRGIPKAMIAYGLFLGIGGWGAEHYTSYVYGQQTDSVNLEELIRKPEKFQGMSEETFGLMKNAAILHEVSLLGISLTFAGAYLNERRKLKDVQN